MTEKLGGKQRVTEKLLEKGISREQAEQTLSDVLLDEPDWREILGLVRLEFGDDEARVGAL